MDWELMLQAQCMGVLIREEGRNGELLKPLRIVCDRVSVAGEEAAEQPLRLEDLADVSEARFMESYESAHSDQSFTSRLARKLGVTKAPLRLDSQTKYGEF